MIQPGFISGIHIGESLWLMHDIMDLPDRYSTSQDTSYLLTFNKFLISLITLSFFLIQQKPSVVDATFQSRPKRCTM